MSDPSQNPRHRLYEQFFERHKTQIKSLSPHGGINIYVSIIFVVMRKNQNGYATTKQCPCWIRPMEMKKNANIKAENIPYW